MILTNGWLNRIPPLIFEAIVFILTMIKFYESIEDGTCHTPVLLKFMADGIWAFALPLGKYHPQ